MLTITLLGKLYNTIFVICVIRGSTSPRKAYNL